MSTFFGHCKNISLTPNECNVYINTVLEHWTPLKRKEKVKRPLGSACRRTLMVLYDPITSSEVSPPPRSSFKMFLLSY